MPAYAATIDKVTYLSLHSETEQDARLWVSLQLFMERPDSVLDRWTADGCAVRRMERRKE